ncbi:MAG: DUF1385 domain-containing protein [Clostridiales bacterium]|jgi:uncharacterized protein YqhQ|nr:DUF1385 domain-containing protein [Clostridiales bacterium]
MSDKKNKEKNPRLATVGGQAVIEGVMMKGRDSFAVANRMPDCSIKIIKKPWKSVRKKHKILSIPILRGVVNFVEMMMLSYKTLSISAEALGIDDIEPESKFEKWLDKHLGSKLVGVIMGIASVLGVGIGLLLFMWLPVFLTRALDTAAGGGLGLFKNLIEGLVKILIFVLYLWGVSHMSDIKRVFMYHGAEHKSIFCYEKGLPLTVENVKAQTRFHPRCGTSFLFVMLLLSILIYSLPIVPWDNTMLRMLSKIALMPVIVGLGFEFIMFAGKHDNVIIRALSAPGLWMQRITTREPAPDMIECAVASLKSALPDNFPGYDPLTNPDVLPADGIGVTDEDRERLAAKAAAKVAAESAASETETSGDDAEPVSEKAESAGTGEDDEPVIQ